MNDREILDRLWEAHRETPFASFSLTRKLDLRPQEHTATLRLISDLADSGETQNGYRIKRVASTVYKLIKHRANDSDPLPNDSDSPKGKPLINENEAVTGEKESGFSQVIDIHYQTFYLWFTLQKNGTIL